MSELARKAQTALAFNRRAAIESVQRGGLQRTRALLVAAEKELIRRINRNVKAGAGDTFTAVQMKATLEQVHAVLIVLTRGMKDTILASGTTAAAKAAAHTAEYLKLADKAFRGVGSQPLALKESLMLDRASQGVRSSILMRLASSGTPQKGADTKPHKAKLGILERYGVETIGHFEKSLRVGLLTKKSFREMRADLVKESPFLKQAPAHWAARIVRTEVAGAYNKAAWEATREADEQLEDMVKIVVETFDERTGSDSFAVHGQIRRPDEAFEWWDGAYQHPPNRPNDRATTVPHRISWPLPPALRWRDASEIAARWKMEGRKGAPPSRPLMTTVDIKLFGKTEPPKLRKPEDENVPQLAEDSGD